MSRLKMKKITKISIILITLAITIPTSSAFLTNNNPYIDDETIFSLPDQTEEESITFPQVESNPIILIKPHVKKITCIERIPNKPVPLVMGELDIIYHTNIPFPQLIIERSLQIITIEPEPPTLIPIPNPQPITERPIVIIPILT